MENIEIRKTNKVYLKGSLDRFLREWLRNEYIIEKVAEICREDEKKVFSKPGVRFKYVDGAVHGYFIHSMNIAFEIMEDYKAYSKDQKTQRIFMQKDNLFLTEEQIKKLFIENKKFFNIKGLSEEKAMVSKFMKKKTLLVKCAEDGAVDIISGEHSKNDKDSIYIPCCSLTENEFLDGIENRKWELAPNESDDECQRYNETKADLKKIMPDKSNR